MVFLTEGVLWELPLEIANLKKVYNLISAVWKCKVSIFASFVVRTCRLHKFLENRN